MNRGATADDGGDVRGWCLIHGFSCSAHLTWCMLLPRSVRLVCCWLNHPAGGSRLPLVFHSSLEILGQGKESILGTAVVRLSARIPPHSWSLRNRPGPSGLSFLSMTVTTELYMT